MNPLILICLLCFVLCSAVGAQGSEATFSFGLSGASGGPASGEGLLSSLSDDDEMELDEDLSRGSNDSVIIKEMHLSKEERKRKRAKGNRKHKNKSKATTAFNPEHSFYTSRDTSTTKEDLCTSTHLGFCIHGFCKYMEGLREPVCVCMKGYDGERCGIQTLETGKKNGPEVVQTVLVIIAVVLSVISCTAILLMTCAHYRTHKNFLAAYLGTGTEQEKLQKPIGDVVV